MKILLICNDKWHKGQIAIDGLMSLERSEYEIDIITDAKDLQPSMLKNYQVVVLSKSRESTEEDSIYWEKEELQRGFATYVENGGGILATHSGVVAGDNTQILDDLIGCRFVYHPEQSIVATAPLKPHYITEGIKVFREKDEHYIIEVIQGDVDVLFASYSPKQGDESKYETEPYFNAPEILCASGYVRRIGKGRVCALTPGHNHEVWNNSEFQKILINAIKWCGNCN